MITGQEKDRETFLADVLTTAIEGGIYYWSECIEYRWIWEDGTHSGRYQTEPHPLISLAPHGGGNAYAKIIEVDDDNVQVEHEVTPLTVAKGYQLVLEKLSIETSRRFTWARSLNDAGELDAGDADILVQLGLFGEVRYG